jgi:transcriptional regulator with XRE-family HTH domain
MIAPRRISLEDRRQKRGENIATFAAFLGISPALYRRVIGRDPAITDATKAQIATKLGVTPEQIVEFADASGHWLSSAAFLATLDTTPAPADAEVCYEIDLATGRVWSEPALQQATLPTPSQELPHRPLCACDLDEVLDWPRPISLAELRWQRGDTVEQFARWLGISADTCEWLLRGFSAVSDTERQQIAERLGVPITQIEEFMLPARGR